jgi:hypothetical protein
MIPAVLCKTTGGVTVHRNVHGSKLDGGDVEDGSQPSKKTCRVKRQSLCRSKTRCIVHNNIPVRVPYILPEGNRKDLGGRKRKRHCSWYKCSRAKIAG